MENVAKIVNATPGAVVQLPQTIYKLKQLSVPVYQATIHIKCRKCSNYMTNTQSDGECIKCSTRIKAIDSDYFTYIPIKQQLLNSLSQNIDDIIDYHSIVTQRQEITDIHNSKAFETIRKKYPSHIILPLIINTDGARAFRSSSKSLWMIQAYQCYLRPEKRHLIRNILLFAVHCGDQKINMTDFFFPLLQDLNTINKDGGIVMTHKNKTIKFMPLIFSVCCDLPATASLLQMNGHSGIFACSKCLNPGTLVKSDTKNSSVIRYINGFYEKREHDDFLKIYDKLKSNIKKSKKEKVRKSIEGIHGISCLVAARDFDFVRSVAIDHMHCAELGVMKKILHLWLDSTNHTKPYYIKKKNQELLNKRLLSIKSICDFSRKPREVTKFKEFKANELLLLMLYYLRFALNGIIDSKYIKHFHLFCSAMYMLMLDSIPHQKIEEADKRLNRFADEFETLYGRQNITMNIHLIRHISSAVRDCGPLWSQSAYGFESNNGIIVRGITSKRDIAHSITWKYIQKQTQSINGTIKQFSVGKIIPVQLSEDEKELYTILGTELKEKQFIHTKIVLNGVIFKSLRSKKIGTVDYFIQTNDKKLGMVLYYLNVDSNLYACVKMYHMVNEIDHFTEVKDSGSKAVFRVEDIACKMIYLKFGLREYVTKQSNRFEKS